jgi:hypothetical protein
MDYNKDLILNNKNKYHMFYKVQQFIISSSDSFYIGIVGGGVQLGPLGTTVTNRPMYVCMYKGGPKTGPSTATFNDLSCFPF